ncbi:MAG: BON domain-containing protein [Nitrospiraceae bacterium]|nr:BON domain-containing protein [Nitrospiraceae bacterium]
MATSAKNTKVRTTDGVVRASGRTDNAAEKDLVPKPASDICGVKDVKNEMTVENRREAAGDPNVTTPLYSRSTGPQKKVDIRSLTAGIYFDRPPL